MKPEVVRRISYRIIGYWLGKFLRFGGRVGLGMVVEDIVGIPRQLHAIAAILI